MMDLLGAGPAVSSLRNGSAGPALERIIFAALEHAAHNLAPGPVFILGAPRTGSTLIYQAMCSRLALPYIANLTNDHFAETPIVGLAVQKALPVEINFESRYGKTNGAMQPSEGSAVMAHWFAGGHPSAVVSARIVEGREPHFLATLAAAEGLFGAPLVVKNAWNCFRIAYLAQALPSARFIWIRRDIAAAAKSDLAARYATKGSPTAWNSATPANVEALGRLPPAAQVVENQLAFNSAIETGLREHAQGRWHAVWYEDFCTDPEGVLSVLAAFLARPLTKCADGIAISEGGMWRLSGDDERIIEAYLTEHAGRLASARHPDMA